MFVSKNMEENSPTSNLNTEGQIQKPGSGALVGTVIIIILLAIGAYYSWATRNSNNDNPPPLILGNDIVDNGTSSDITAGLPPQSESDEADAISADLEAMNMETFSAQNTESTQSYEASVQ